MLLAAMVMIHSCELVEQNTSFGMQHVYKPHRSTRFGSDSARFQPQHKDDTVLYLSAVRFPPDYDWRRDTLFGAVDAELVLLKDYSEILSIPVGNVAEASADKHHILDGHLYTEHQTSSTTYIGKDGIVILSFEGREELRGLLEDGGILYTLSVPKGGDGFKLRADGQVIYSEKSGTVYGTMSEPSYRQNGALYKDNGHLCFCFRTESMVYRIEDGLKYVAISGAGPGEAQDVRIIDGQVVCAGSDFMGMKWSGARVWPLGNGEYAISGNTDTASYTGPLVYRSRHGSVRKLGGGEGQVYVSSEGEAAVHWSRDGSVTVSAQDKPYDGKWYFMTPECAVMAPGGPAIALTPRPSSNRSLVRYAGNEKIVELNGFLTGIWITTEHK